MLTYNIIELTETNASRMELHELSGNSNTSNTTNTTVDATTSTTNNDDTIRDVESLPYIDDRTNTIEYQRDMRSWYQRRNVQTLILAGIAFGVCSYLFYKYATTPTTTTGTRTRKPRYSLKYRFK